MSVKGWLFDAYASSDKMVLWVKTDSGKCVRLTDSWSHSIYVAAENKQDLVALANNAAVQHYTKSSEFVSRYEKINDSKQSQVLKLALRDSSKASALASAIEDINFDKFRLYNVDILPAQAYFYERDLYPLAKCKVSDHNGKLSWQIDNNLKESDYDLPDFTISNLDVSLKQQGRLPRFTDKINEITLKLSNETIVIQSQTEQDALFDLMR
jgi:DNA polymerase, archaea type